jgi:hypothetical protein
VFNRTSSVLIMNECIMGEYLLSTYLLEGLVLMDRFEIV